MGRPKIYDANILACKLLDYIDNTDQPLIKQFCLIEDVAPDTLYRLEKENKNLSDAMKKAIDKQEVFLILNGSTGKVNPVFAIFRLKQKCFGYTDKAEIDVKAIPADTDREALEATLISLLAEMQPSDRQLLLNSSDNPS